MGINRMIATLRRRSAREEGFSLIEVTMAIGVLFIALLALARTATVAFSDVSFGRQRQVGNQLANELLEEVRALPYDTIKKGLSSTDLTGDPNIVSCGGSPIVYRYQSCSTGEKIVYSPGLTTPVSPLIPHTGTFGPPNYSNTYSWKTYVTEATGVPSSGAYRVMVFVDWNSTTRGGARTEVNLQTLVYSPIGCTDTATHPFGAPCQAYFYSTASVGSGTYEVSGPFFTEPYDAIHASLVGESSDIQLEQISRVEGDSKLLNVSKTVSGVDTATSSGVATASDTDPATTTGTYESLTVGPQAVGSQEVQSGGNKMTLNLGSGSTGSSISTTSAGGAQACNLQIDALPCGYASTTQSGTLNNTLTLTPSGLGTTTLFSVGSSSTPITTYARRYKPVATQNGLIRETVSWNLPEIRIGAIPSTISPPTGWLGYWVRLTGFTATSTVEAGVSTAAPSVTISGGTIQYWNGSGYTSAAVTAAGGEFTPTPVNERNNSNPKPEVTMSGTVGFDASTTSFTGDATSRTEAKALIGSPLVVEMDYVLETDNIVQADLDVLFTAGAAELTATYTP